MRRWRNLQPFPGREFLGEVPTAPSSRRAWQEVGKGAVLVSQAGRGHESINIPSESALCSPATGCQGLPHAGPGVIQSLKGWVWKPIWSCFFPSTVEE